MPARTTAASSARVLKCWPPPRLDLWGMVALCHMAPAPMAGYFVLDRFSRYDPSVATTWQPFPKYSPLGSAFRCRCRHGAALTRSGVQRRWVSISEAWKVDLSISKGMLTSDGHSLCHSGNGIRECSGNRCVFEKKLRSRAKFFGIPHSPSHSLTFLRKRMSHSPIPIPSGFKWMTIADAHSNFVWLLGLDFGSFACLPQPRFQTHLSAFIQSM